MIINFQTKLTNPLSNDPIYLSQDKKDQVTLSDVCISALVTQVAEDKFDGKKKFEFWELAKKINKNNNIDLKAEEVSIIKERVGKIYAPIIVGVVFDLLESGTELCQNN